MVLCLDLWSKDIRFFNKCALLVLILSISDSRHLVHPGKELVLQGSRPELLGSEGRHPVLHGLEDKPPALRGPEDRPPELREPEGRPPELREPEDRLPELRGPEGRPPSGCDLSSADRLPARPRRRRPSEPCWVPRKLHMAAWRETLT